ncbi:MAG: DNA-directed RNA polymerase subunit omega [Clostridia bacterium]|nr:DNA-directed RNA polymerase subunit omega [Clostridia bacterium]
MSVNQPGIVELSQKVDSRYTLVIESAKRGRQIVAGAQPLINAPELKPVSIAIEEINRGLLTYRRNMEDEDQ